MVDAELCLSLYIQKSCLAVFKGMGVSDFEVHHGGSAIHITRDGWYKLANRAKPSLPFTVKMKKYY